MDMEDESNHNHQLEHERIIMYVKFVKKNREETYLPAVRGMCM